MKQIAALVLIIVGLCGSSLCQYTAEFSSYRGDKRYDFRITHGQLARTPEWSEGQPDPPLPARRAQSIAAAYLRELFADADEWRHGSIALVPLNERWVYTVEFIEPPANCADCMSTPFRVVVLMDGTVVSASVSQWKPYPSVHGDLR